jgi:DNA topoisomerase-3
MPPPALYDLTELQRHANRLFGFSAQKTLDIAQALYERHKLISYPRTDSRHLSQDVARTLPRIVAAIEAPYRDRLAPGTGERPLGRRFVDDSKVTDHHAIIPTATSPDGVSLTSEERRIYDLICRRLLSAWHGDHVWSVTTVITAIRNPGVTDRYHTSGSEVKEAGWKVLDFAPAAKTAQGKPAGAGQGAPGAGQGKAGAGDSQAEQVLPPGLAKDQPQDVVDVEVLQKKTRPPKRLTEATLLTAMETAGRTLDEKELSDAMKETGLGTPATRAAIIEVLLKRAYIVRDGKSLAATEKGIRLIEVVHPEVKSPVMTGQWEAYLHRIQRGTAELAPFLKGIEDYVTEVVGKVGGVDPAAAAGQRLRPATEAERAAALAVVAALRKGGKSTGRLHSELHSDGAMTRHAFEDLLAAMARSGMVRLTDEVFEKDGKSIPYRRASLVTDQEPTGILMKADAADAAPTVRKAPVTRKKTRAAAGKRRRVRRPASEDQGQE